MRAYPAREPHHFPLRPSPFFLFSADEEIYGLHIAPACDTPVVGAILWVQPFAEEANCARRHIVAAARECADEGYASLLIDLYGTGESAGELIDASWQVWQKNICDAARWLRQTHAVPLWLCGVRAGALFAANVTAELSPAGVLCWQPVGSGRLLLDNFLRMKLASEWSRTESARATEILGDLRASLRAGNPVEIAGYEISAALADEISVMDLSWLPAACPAAGVQEFRSARADMQTSEHTPAVARLADRLRACGISVATAICEAPAFWQSHEVPPAEGAGRMAALLLRRLEHD